VLLTSAGHDPEMLIQTVCEAAAVSRQEVEAAIADRPRFVARDLPEREAHKLVLGILRAGGWSELHPHEPGEAARPACMDESMIAYTRQMADLFAQQQQLRQAAGVVLPDDGQFDELYGSVDRVRDQQRQDDESRAAGLSPAMLRPPVRMIRRRPSKNGP
jgi:hypothetical protein